jgi:hypothetical protein
MSQETVESLFETIESYKQAIESYKRAIESYERRVKMPERNMNGIQREAFMAGFEAGRIYGASIVDPGFFGPPCKNYEKSWEEYQEEIINYRG